MGLVKTLLETDEGNFDVDESDNEGGGDFIPYLEGVVRSTGAAGGDLTPNLEGVASAGTGGGDLTPNLEGVESAGTGGGDLTPNLKRGASAGIGGGGDLADNKPEEKADAEDGRTRE